MRIVCHRGMVDFVVIEAYTCRYSNEPQSYVHLTELQSYVTI